MVLNVHRNHLAYQGWGKGGLGGGGCKGVWRWGEREIIPIATLSPPECSCVKMGSDESCFNVSLIVRDKVTRDKVTRHCPQTTTLEEKGELKWN